jgi:hypothetical protein
MVPAQVFSRPGSIPRGSPLKCYRPDGTEIGWRTDTRQVTEHPTAPGPVMPDDTAA